MNVFEILANEWPLIAAAPALVIGGAAIIACTVFSSTWWLKGKIDDGERATLMQRLELAKDREFFANEKQRELEKKIADLTSKIDVNASPAELKILSAKVDTALLQLQAANNAVHYVLNAEPGKYLITGGDAQLDR